MTYLQTTCSSIDDLMSKIANFSAQFGWAIARNSTFDSNPSVPSSRKDKVIVLSKSGSDNVILASIYSNASSSVATELYIGRSFGAVATGDIDSFASCSAYAMSNLLTAGPYVNLYLFGENDYVHCVIEHVAGRFRHFGFGNLVKKGVWNGGAYSYGTYWDQPAYAVNSMSYAEHVIPFGRSRSGRGNANCIRCSNSSLPRVTSESTGNRSGDYMINRSGSPNFNFAHTTAGPVASGAGIEWIHIQEMLPYTYNAYNQRFTLTRIPVFCTDTGITYRYIGEYPAVRAFLMDAFVPGEELTIGSDIWKVFPIISKSYNNDLVEKSYGYALAYRKVT